VYIITCQEAIILITDLFNRICHRLLKILRTRPKMCKKRKSNLDTINSRAYFGVQFRGGDLGGDWGDGPPKIWGERKSWEKKGKIWKTWSMTKKGHQKFWPWKWIFFPETTSFRNLGPRKLFPSPQTLRQVSATGPVDHNLCSCRIVPLRYIMCALINAKILVKLMIYAQIIRFFAVVNPV